MKSQLEHFILGRQSQLTIFYIQLSCEVAELALPAPRSRIVSVFFQNTAHFPVDHAAFTAHGRHVKGIPAIINGQIRNVDETLAKKNSSVTRCYKEQ